MVASHELRTPLTAIIGSSDLVASEVTGPVTAKQKEQMSRIAANAWQLVTLVDEMLAYARTEAGVEHPRLESTDAALVAREVVPRFAVQAQAKGLELLLSVPEEPVMIRTDPGKLRQMVTNLLGNAIKFTEAGRVELELRQREGGVEIRVRDTGPGIATEDQERIFQPFAQEVESAPMDGSTFLLRLPHLDEEAR